MFVKDFIRVTLLSAALVLPAGATFAQAQQGECAVGVPPSGTSPNANPGSGSLTEKLDDCNGVLKPPAVGDSEIVEPAPQTGQMPVITPNDVPQDGNPPQQP
ncbi:hypothetical protein G8E10_22340 [Rhizobiaceae bacterium CRRU44]|uniref:Intersectin-EH binding protein Ibp1 n=1 Tax=Ferranicluibacter rubi TaxID=2715133 RepID=A0AA43ZK10_9HYPH|nr:hypothetical protein [Ferranicluibacter rubi]NHT78450.1 hypothetical protein [Ferranicluibacter rubi]